MIYTRGGYENNWVNAKPELNLPYQLTLPFTRW
jgi:hypothetical protein